MHDDHPDIFAANAAALAWERQQAARKRAQAARSDDDGEAAARLLSQAQAHDARADDIARQYGGGGRMKHAGRSYAVRTGPRGGRFIVVQGRKVYC
jgi:hypothetical protein